MTDFQQIGCELEKILITLKKVYVKKNHVLKNVPEGTLKVIKCRNTFQYYWRKTKNDKEGIYIEKKNLSFVKALAQKEYDLKLQKELKTAIANVEKIIHLYTLNKLISIYSNMPEGKQQLIIPDFQINENYIQQWQKVNYQQKKISENTPLLLTSKGERVRSKSEVLIAEKLKQANIPYRYEYPVYLNYNNQRIKINPDFFCLNPYTNEEIIWEHFGLMDDIKYVHFFIDKFYTYTQNNWIPGKNLIFTFENQKHPLNNLILDTYIKKYFSKN